MYVHQLLYLWASLVGQLVKNPPTMQETPVWFPGQEDPLEKDRLPTPVFLGFPDGSVNKESACNCRRSGFNPWIGKIPCRKARLPTSCLQNPHGQRSLVGCSPWGCKEWSLSTQHIIHINLIFREISVVGLPLWLRC